MDKRYQVFVSSTFADLQDERSNVIQTLMEMDCIPAGMELFPALDEEQFEFIKKVIDDSDYYLLIIGGRYGSLSDEGISYTEMEYDYAISKGIKVIALVHNNPDKLTAEKVEMDSEAQEKLMKFRDKVTNKRLVKFWSDAKELPGLVALSLPKTIKTYPAEGWVRASNATDDNELLRQINEIRKENEKLNKMLKNLEDDKKEVLNLAQGDDEVGLSFECAFLNKTIIEKCWHEETISWNILLKIIGPKILKPIREEKVKQILAEYITSKSSNEFLEASIKQSDFEKIKIQLMALDYIKVDGNSGINLYWEITPKGEKYLIQIISLKRKVDEPKND